MKGFAKFLQLVMIVWIVVTFIALAWMVVF